MRSREVQTYLSSITGRPLSEIDQRCRTLRGGDKIASGPRGIHAPHMTVVSVMFHICCLISKRPKDAWNVAERVVTECVVVSNISDKPQPESSIHLTAGSFLLSAMVKKPLFNLDLVSMEFEETGNFAWANLRRAPNCYDRLLFRVPNSFIGNDVSHYAIDEESAGNRFVIGKRHLEYLGAQAAKDDPEGVNFDDE